MRIACLHIPHFPVTVERARQPDLQDQPVVIGGTPEERKVVFDCSQEAIRHGVQIGMPLREALSHCREAAFLDANHALYYETAAAINRALDLISPLIEPADLGQAFIGLNGLGKDPDAELLLAHEIAQATGQVLYQLCLTPVRAAVQYPSVKDSFPPTNARHSRRHLVSRLMPKVGIADSKFAAFAAATTSVLPMPRIILPGQTPTFLADLPVTYLPVSQDTQRRLSLFGLRTLGQLATLPVGAVQAQFGPEGRIAWELANGIDNSPLIPQKHIITLVEKLSFPAPISSADAMLAAAQHLLIRITNRPEFARHATRGLVFKAMLTNGLVWERKLIFREPLAAHDHIFFALHAKLGDVSLPAAVEDVEIELLDICGEVGLQGNLFVSQRGRLLSRVDEVIRQLKSRYGRTPVAKVVEVEPWSRIPERRLALIDYDP